MSVDADVRDPSDADLITAVAAGDDDAYGLLWQRHEAAARRFAAQLTRPANVDDLVSEGFLRVLRAIKAGGGPESAFRPYLFNTIRRYNIDTGRSYGQRVALTDDTAELDVEPAESAGEAYAAQAEQRAAWQAWQSLPEDSRALLWHLIVEEETPAQVAPLLGVSANGVASRAVRARERLRQAFLVQHAALADTDECRQARAKLGGYVRNALATRERKAVDEHLRRCDRCAAAVAELTDVNHTMRVLIAPLLLGGGLIVTRYLAASHGAATAVAAGSTSAGRGAMHVWGLGAKVAAAAGVAACAAGAIAYTLVAGGSSHVAEPPARAAASAPGIASGPAAPPVPTTTGSSAPTTAAPVRTAPPGTPPAPPPPPPPPAAHPPATSSPVRPAVAVASPAHPSLAPRPAEAASAAPTTPRSSTPPPTPPRSPSTSSAPTAAPAQARVSIPLPDGTATVTAAAPDGWTITGWHTYSADASGGPTDPRHATWQITDGGTLVVTATGPPTPSAALVVAVTPAGGAPQASSYPLT